MDRPFLHGSTRVRSIEYLGTDRYAKEKPSFMAECGPRAAAMRPGH